MSLPFSPRGLVFAALFSLLPLLAPAAEAPDRIVQRDFAAFSQGTLGNAGANLYVSQRGRVQVINKWDLNGDGYNDAVFSNDHDVFEIVDAFIYWNSKSGFTSLLPELWRERPLATVAFGLMDQHSALTRLPAFGGGKSLVVDLNKDGFLDIVFCNYIHNYPGIRSAYVYWGSATGYKVSNKTELPTAWAAGVAAADLNGDGYPELVFANQGTEAGAEDIQQVRENGSYIYWGSATGFDVARRSVVPTHGARDVAIADVNHDGKPDLAFINNGPAGNDLQVFLGSATPFAESKGQVIPLSDPTSIRAADLNRDGFDDLVITASAPPQTIGYAALRDQKGPKKFLAYVAFGSAAGITAQGMSELPTLEGRSATVGDFNGDGWPDIAIANSSDGKTARVSSYIYWGGKAGFSVERRSELPTLGANGVAAADLNGDGQVDLVFANSTDDVTHDVPSYIYWGSPTGFAPYMRTDVQGFGAASVNTADLNGDGRPEIILVNQYSGSEAEVNSHIYWGNPHHFYSTASMTSLPTHGAYGTTAADFNDDGRCDLLICNSYQAGSYLYWGHADGFSTAHRQTLEVGRVLGSAAVDLNRDGYLDLIFAGNSAEEKNVGTILWGSADGFVNDHKTVLPLKTQRCANINVADLNHDGFPDLVYNDDYFGNMQIFWGNAKAEYTPDQSWFHATSGGSLGLADLNGDGNLDFIISGGFDPKKLSPNTKTRIFWGTPAGTPSPDHVVELEAYQACEVSVSDLNRDGYLDLVLGNYMSESTRSLPMFVFWGGPGGKYSDQNRLELPAESSCGIETVDLNRDGYPELIVHNHLKDGVHTINSYIYWNGPQGFNRDRRTELPNFGPHYTAMTDPGNIYTRKLEEEFISAPIEIPAGRSARRLAWKAEEPHGTKLHFQVRSAASAADLAKQAWQAADTGDLAATGRWVQYRALFTSPDAGEWPVLSEVEIHLK